MSEEQLFKPQSANAEPARLPDATGAGLPTSPPPEASEAPDKAKGGSSLRPFVFVIAAMIAVVLVATLVGIIVALADPGAAEKVGAVRDIFIIVLAWFSILICLSIVVLVLQVASLVNLLKNEVIPVLSSLQETANTVRGTSQFVSVNLAQPVIRAQGLLAAIRKILEILHLMSPDRDPFEDDGRY